MNQFMRRCAIALAICLILTCGVLAYAEVIPQNLQAEESAESVLDEAAEEEYTESKVVFTDDDMMILPRPVRDGKKFIEWNTKEDGTGEGYKAGEIVDPESIELYAIWTDAETADAEVPDEEAAIEEEPAAEATVSEATVIEAVYDEELQEEIIDTEDVELQDGEVEE